MRGLPALTVVPSENFFEEIRRIFFMKNLIPKRVMEYIIITFAVV